MIRPGDRFDAQDRRWKATSISRDHGGAVGYIVRAAPCGADLMSEASGEVRNVQIDPWTRPVELPERKLPA